MALIFTFLSITNNIEIETFCLNECILIVQNDGFIIIFNFFRLFYSHVYENKCMFSMYVCMYTTYVSGAYRGQKKVMHMNWGPL